MIFSAQISVLQVRPFAIPFLIFLVPFLKRSPSRVRGIDVPNSLEETQSWLTKDCQHICSSLLRVNSPPRNYFVNLIFKFRLVTEVSQAGSFAIQNSRTQQRINSFSCSGAKAWNCIPLNIHSLSKHKFKAAIHRQLLDILLLYLIEDDYVDTLTITSRFKQL